MTQKEALNILKTGANAFITGAAGSGKTHLLREYIAYLKNEGVSVGVTASTGIAATHMGGMTIHSWSGIGIRDTLTRAEIARFREMSHLKKRFEKTHVLIIDEISMLHHYRLDLVEMLVSAFRQSSMPFGGIQVIVCGDFFQLPPVARPGEPEAHFAYHSTTWRDLDLKICYLEEAHRQSDHKYLAILNAIRNDEISDDVIEALQSRFDQQPAGSGRPTKLYSHNANVDAENERELAKLPGDTFEYSMVAEKGRAQLIEVLKKTCLAPEFLRLKKGARVMFVKNNIEEGYANGTLGTVIECDENEITVETTNGDLIQVPQESWRIEEEGKTKAEITQYPLRLAWAITVHKSQGMSLDSAEIDLSRSFEPGMGYVALSRVRTLSGLSLKGFNNMALRVHEEALVYDKEFRTASERHADDIRDMTPTELAERHAEFLARIRPAKGKSSAHAKEEKSTFDETRALLLQEFSIADIAVTRDLKEGTILSHIEEILRREPGFDITHLRRSMQPARFQRIAAALKKSGKNKNGEYALSPARDILGKAFLYDEIRFVRLFL